MTFYDTSMKKKYIQCFIFRTSKEWRNGSEDRNLNRGLRAYQNSSLDLIEEKPKTFKVLKFLNI